MFVGMCCCFVCGCCMRWLLCWVAYAMVVGVRHCGIVALILSLLLVCLDLRWLTLDWF